MVQDFFLCKEVRQERARIVALAHGALEGIVRLDHPLLETRLVNGDTSFAVTTAYVHQLAFFF
jgi:hypothetical protein